VTIVRHKAFVCPGYAKHFFDHVAGKLDGVDSGFIVGPGSAELESFTFVYVIASSRFT
jgi:hypothetical protein